MKSQNKNRLAFIRSRALALHVVSFASLGAPIATQSASPSVSAHSLSSPSLPSPPSLPCAKSAHVWHKGGKGGNAQDADTNEALPSGFIPSLVEPFSPLVSREMLAEVEPIAYAEALPEIGAHNLAHSVNCMLLCLPWRG